jgi:hypothetical protein
LKGERISFLDVKRRCKKKEKREHISGRVCFGSNLNIPLVLGKELPP